MSSESTIYVGKKHGEMAARLAVYMTKQASKPVNTPTATRIAIEDPSGGQYDDHTSERIGVPSTCTDVVQFFGRSIIESRISCIDNPNGARRFILSIRNG